MIEFEQLAGAEVELTLRDGEKVVGILRSSGPKGLELEMADGKIHRFASNQVTSWLLHVTDSD
jgi:hypothetical protein